MFLECQAGEIACDVSRCILQTQKCDFKSDCEDGSDEAGCKYPGKKHFFFQNFLYGLLLLIVPKRLKSTSCLSQQDVA